MLIQAEGGLIDAVTPFADEEMGNAALLQADKDAGIERDEHGIYENDENDVGLYEERMVFPAMEGAVMVATLVEVPHERLKDLLTCALEGGSNYWYVITEAKPRLGKAKADYEFWHLDIPFDGGSLMIGEKEDPDFGPKELSLTGMADGLELMAEKHPGHFADVMNENEDAITGDVFLQLALFGEVVFG